MKRLVLRVAGFLVLLLTACANVGAPLVAPLVPPPPQYAPTAVPTPPVKETPVPPLPGADAQRQATDAGGSAARVTRTPIALKTPVRDLSILNEYQRGIAYVAFNRNEYYSTASKQALDELFATGANYISLLVTWYQNDWRSTQIGPSANTPSDQELAYVIAYAHANGVRVLLKPQIDLLNDPQRWRGQIEFDNETDWAAWFASYRKFILYYARFAQNNGVEEFSVGTELVAASKRTADWRGVIRAVRTPYSGLLTYSANHSGEEVQVRFWDDLDFIGVNVFYHLTNYRTPTIEQVLKGWELPVRQLTNLHNAFPKQPIIFTEVGYPSLDLASVWPWNWQRAGAIDTAEQALLYQGLFLTWWRNPALPWFRGMFIWNWLANPEQGGMENPDYTPHGKPAEQILKYYYQESQQSGMLPPNFAPSR